METRTIIPCFSNQLTSPMTKLVTENPQLGQLLHSEKRITMFALSFSFFQFTRASYFFIIFDILLLDSFLMFSVLHPESVNSSYFLH